MITASNKLTKIICTIGPSSESTKVLTELVRNGMNVARLNFSHGTYPNHARIIKNIREVSLTLGVPIAILQDLQGPKIRVAAIHHPVVVKSGQQVVIGEDFNLDFDITQSVKPKQRILIEDGLIELRVIRVLRSAGGMKRAGKIYCEVMNAGTIQSHKGINLPDTNVKFPVLTEKDIRDLKFGLKQNVDYVALSFVRHGKDIRNLKKLIAQNLAKGRVAPKVIAKIERKEALDNFRDILKETDAVMVARGDLGVEIADSQVPLAQKLIISESIKVAKPVIVATQMLDSMIRNPRPTRAEVSDVANAVIDRADAVMLSGESATGKYPVQAVSEMNRIIQATEKSPYGLQIAKITGGPRSRSAAIAESAAQLAKDEKAQAIIGATETGFSARVIAHQRPHVPIIMLTDIPAVGRQMALVWGVIPLLVKRFPTLEELMTYYIAAAKQMKLVKRGQRVVMVAGEPLGEKMNLVEVKTVK